MIGFGDAGRVQYSPSGLLSEFDICKAMKHVYREKVAFLHTALAFENLFPSVSPLFYFSLQRCYPISHFLKSRYPLLLGTYKKPFCLEIKSGERSKSRWPLPHPVHNLTS